MISIHRQNIWLSTLWRRNMLLIHQLLILRFPIFKRHIPLFHFSKERLIWGRYLFKILRVSNDLSYFPMCRSRTSFFIFRNIFVIPAFQDHFLQRHGQNILQYQYIAISISFPTETWPKHIAGPIVPFSRRSDCDAALPFVLPWGSELLFSYLRQRRGFLNSKS